MLLSLFSCLSLRENRDCFQPVLHSLGLLASFNASFSDTETVNFKTQQTMLSNSTFNIANMTLLATSLPVTQWLECPTNVRQVRWNVDLIKCKGTGEIGSLFGGFTISRFFSIHYSITGLKNIVHYTKHFIIQRFIKLWFHCNGFDSCWVTQIFSLSHTHDELNKLFHLY